VWAPAQRDRDRQAESVIEARLPEAERDMIERLATRSF
jgi:hypothetical protein